MITHICILRGINVGWHNKITMDMLAQQFTELGFGEVQTYIQSGNVLFHADETDTERLTHMISHMISQTRDLDIPVQVKTVDQWRQIIKSCPYSKWNTDNLYVTLLSSPPVKKWTPDLIAACTQWEEFSIVDQQVYLLCPQWYGTTKLSNSYLEKKLKTQATTRNWNTMNAILEMI